MPTPYRSTPMFDETTLPAAFRAEHRTKAGVWGLVRVLEGQLKLTYLEPRSEKIVTATTPAIIYPEQPHFAEPLGPMRMQVDFYHEDPGG